MKKSRLILMVISCLVIAGGCMRSQSTYYVDPSGDDTRDGTSADKAWRTLNKVNSVSYSPGDQVLLKRGGVWHESLPVNCSGSSGNPIVYADYGTGPKPVIDLGGQLPSWLSSIDWSNQGGNVWSISASFPGRMWFKRPEFSSLREFGLPGYSNATSTYNYDNNTGSSVVDSRYRWWWSGGTLYVYSIGNPASYYTNIEVADLHGENGWSGKSYVTFKNLEFRRGSICIEMDNCDYFTFDSCKVLGGTARYGLFVRHGSDHGVIQNHCTFDREDTVMHQFGYGGSSAAGGGDDNIAFQSASYWDVHDSYFGGTGHAGIEITGEVDNGYYSNYNKIHDNEFEGSGDYCRAFLCQGYSYDRPSDSTTTWACHHNDFYRNYIHGMTVISDVGSIYCRVFYNVFADQGRIWWDDLRPGYSPGEQIWRGTMLESENVYPCYHLQVFNNTFYTAKGSAYRFGGNNSKYNSFKNNIIYNVGLVGQLNTNWFCPYTALEIWPGVTKDTIQNNIIYSPNQTATIALYQETWGHGWTPRTVAYMEANPGPNVISGNIARDPKLLPDFRILSTSPAKGAGVNVGLTQDFFGTSVSGTKPDIGACEAPSATAPAAVEESSSSPARFLLEQNYPNPFNPTTVIRYTVPRESRVVLEIFNILGQSVTKLVDAVSPAGMHEARFDGHALASGTYLYRLQTEGQPPLVRKMSVLK